MKESDLAIFKELMAEYNCNWINTERGKGSDDWKALIFGRKNDSLQIAIYDRKKGFMLRLEHEIVSVANVEKMEKCPKGDGFNHPESHFKDEKGYSVKAADLPAVKDVLNIYYGKHKNKIDTFDKYVISLDARVETSRLDSEEKRVERLKSARKKPKLRTVSITIYDRNPDVVSQTLISANGLCQSCKQKAPFNRLSNGQPFLEVHHKTPLSKGGDDTVENAIALCPNCHRKYHYG